MLGVLKYNELPDIINQKDPSDDIICEISYKIKNLKLQNKFGVFLIHKHFDIENDQIMFDEFKNNKCFSYPTKINKNMFPHRWIVINNNLVPFEYSEYKSEEPPKELINFINSKKYYNLGIYYICEEFPDKYSVEHTEIFLNNNNNLYNKVNITEYIDEPLVDESLYRRTSWEFKDNKKYATCMSYCMKTSAGNHAVVKHR